jgi:predicted O-methyltransferase YrrM
MGDFEGTTYRTAKNWFPVIPVENKPIRYAEIGVFYGANLISVANSYAAHPDSKLYGIDPWIDYNEYPEYKNEQSSIYDTFQRNIHRAGISDKLTILRDFSHRALQTLEDDSLDIIYIDGNHNPEYVLEDAVLTFRKVKIGGYIIFDDYGWGGPDLTAKGIDAFAKAYSKRTNYLGLRDSQAFFRRAT